VPPPELPAVKLRPEALLPLAVAADAEPGYTVISASATPLGLCTRCSSSVCYKPQQTDASVSTSTATASSDSSK